ncbi:MAG: DUF4416 family protein [Pirellulaceae bacterium]
MGEIRTHRPVLLVMAAFSRYPEALDWGRARAAAEFGPQVLESPRMPFEQTKFYERSMGSGLEKTLWAFKSLMDPLELPTIKLATNDWEQAYQREHEWPESRPLNLDPGYITEAKLVLATTKDRDHRLYLGNGIFGEVTLYYHAGNWCARPWTYPDYQQPAYHEFFDQCRKYLREQYHRGDCGEQKW